MEKKTGVRNDIEAMIALVQDRASNMEIGTVSPFHGPAYPCY